MNNGRERLALLLYVSLLIVSGIYLIEHKVFWIDELATGIHMLRPIATFWEEAQNQAHAPVFNFTLKLYSTLFGVKPISLASFSLIIGVIVIIYSYFSKRNDGILLVFLTLIHPDFLHFSVEVKQYIFTYLVAFIMMQKLIAYHSGYSFRAFLLMHIVALVGFYTHPWFFILYVSMVITSFYLGFVKERRLWTKHEMLTIIGTLTLSIPVVIMYFNMQKNGAIGWIDKFSIIELLRDAVSFLFGNWLYGSVLAILIGANIFTLKRNKVISKDSKVLLSVFCLTILIALIINIFYTIFFLRYLFILFPLINLILLNLTKRIFSLFNIQNYWKLLLYFLALPIVAYNATDEVKREKNWSDTFVEELSFVANEAKFVGYKTLVVTFGKYGFYHYYNQVEYDGKMNVYPVPQEDADHPGFIAYDRLDIDKELIQLGEKVNQEDPSSLILVVSPYYKLDVLIPLFNKYIPGYIISKKEFIENHVLVMRKPKLIRISE